MVNPLTSMLHRRKEVRYSETCWSCYLFTHELTIISPDWSVVIWTNMEVFKLFTFNHRILKCFQCINPLYDLLMQTLIESADIHRF
jgi:hypothetical protein